MHLLYVALASIATLFAAIATVFIFTRAWRTPSPLRSTAMNAALLLYSLAFALLAAEALVYHFAVYSDGYTITLAHKRWQERHWQPINSLGLRGPEPACPPPNASPVLLVVGDSFTEGAGLEDYTDRYSEQLKPLVGKRWHVETLARAGWDTPKQTEQLLAYPCSPTRVLLAYYLNDIKSAANAAGGSLGKALQHSATMAFLLNHSHLVNFAYYRLYRAYTGFFSNAIDPIAHAYASETIWAEHLKQIDAFIAACRSRGASLDVVIFPDLNNLERTRPLTEQAQKAFESLGLRVLNLSAAFAGRDAASLTINALDGHPNTATHREIAQLLASHFAY